MLDGEGCDLRPAHHGAVIIDQFGNDTDRREAGHVAKVDGCFRVPGAHEHAAFAGDQGKDMARTNEVAGADIRVGEVAHRQRPIVRRDAGAGTMLEVDRDGECRRMRTVIVGDHGGQIEALGLFLRHGGTDDARGMTHDEGHLFRRAMHGGNDQIPFVLPPIVIHDDHDLPGFKGSDRLDDTFLIVGHGKVLIWSGRSGPGLSGYDREECRRASLRRQEQRGYRRRGRGDPWCERPPRCHRHRSSAFPSGSMKSA